MWLAWVCYIIHTEKGRLWASWGHGPLAPSKSASVERQTLIVFQVSSHLAFVRRCAVQIHLLTYLLTMLPLLLLAINRHSAFKYCLLNSLTHLFVCLCYCAWSQKYKDCHKKILAYSNQKCKCKNNGQFYLNGSGTNVWVRAHHSASPRPWLVVWNMPLGSKRAYHAMH